MTDVYIFQVFPQGVGGIIFSPKAGIFIGLLKKEVKNEKKDEKLGFFFQDKCKTGIFFKVNAKQDFFSRYMLNGDFFSR